MTIYKISNGAGLYASPHKGWVKWTKNGKTWRMKSAVIYQLETNSKVYALIPGLCVEESFFPSKVKIPIEKFLAKNS